MIEINGKEFRNLPQQVAKNANDIEDLQEQVAANITDINTLKGKHIYVTTAAYVDGSTRKENAEYWQYKFTGTITFLTTTEIESDDDLKNIEVVACSGVIKKYDDSTDVRTPTVLIDWTPTSGQNSILVVGSDEETFEIDFSNPINLKCRQLF